MGGWARDIVDIYHLGSRRGPTYLSPVHWTLEQALKTFMSRSTPAWLAPLLLSVIVVRLQSDVPFYRSRLGLCLDRCPIEKFPF